MGSEPVSARFHIEDETGAEEELSAPLSYDELIKKVCPEYMAMGMTYDEYWNGDNEAPRYYRKMAEVKKKQRNYELWLQGMYIYDALLCASPMFRFSMKPQKALPYPTEPYPLDETEKKHIEELHDKREMENMRADMETWMKKVNK